jgi:hypothetical protein
MRKTPPPPPVEVLTQLSFEDFKNGVISICGNPHDYPQAFIRMVIEASKRRIRSATAYRDLARTCQDRKTELAVEISNSELPIQAIHAMRRELSRLEKENYLAWAEFYTRTLREHQRLLQFLYLCLSTQAEPEDYEVFKITPRVTKSWESENKEWLAERRQKREADLDKYRNCPERLEARQAAQKEKRALQQHPNLHAAGKTSQLIY